MTRHSVCKVDDVAIGKLTEVNIGRSTIILSRLPSGEIRAINSRCPHQGADLGHGCVAGLVDGDVPNRLELTSTCDILRCPWHGFEFSLIDGQPTVPSLETMPMQLRFYSVEVEGDQVVVTT
jgi:nitrite reductase/ring-hydroxylating ferredoxin subunit